MIHQRTSQKFNFPSEYKNLLSRVGTLEKSLRDSGYLIEVNTSGLTNSQIDEKVFGEEILEPLNGKLISDPTNKIILIRQNGIWIPEWIIPSLGSWSNYEKEFSSISYKKDFSNFVHLKGLVKSTAEVVYGYTASSEIAVLKFSPLQNEVFNVWGEDSNGVCNFRVDIASTGQVFVRDRIGFASGTVNYISLSGIIFLSEK